MKDSNIIIREYTEQDNKQLLALFHDFINYFVKIDDMNRCINNNGANNYCLNKMLKAVKEKEGKIYIAEKEDQIIGFIAGTIKNLPNDEESKLMCIPSRMGRVIDLFISEQSRGIGVGHKLMEIMENYFKDQKCDVVHIEVFGPNLSAQEFYKKHNYHPRNLDLIKRIS